jgi:hypothetical protein
VKACNDKFEYIKRISNDYVKPGTLDAHKKAKAAFKRLGKINLIGESEKFSMSNKRMGSLFGRSKSTASLLMKFGRINNLVNVFANYERVNVSPHYVDETKGYFISGNNVFKRKANRIVFTVSFF